MAPTTTALQPSEEVVLTRAQWWLSTFGLWRKEGAVNAEAIFSVAESLLRLVSLFPNRMSTYRSTCRFAVLQVQSSASDFHNRKTFLPKPTSPLPMISILCRTKTWDCR